MKNPKISVIMAVYNGMPHLKEAVRSILFQTYKDFEFIIVDDASDDKSFSYLSNLKDKRIKLIKNSKNLGLANSLNKGLRVAKGKYIARMDADDISLPKRLQEQFKYLTDNPAVDLCGTWAYLIDESGKVIGEKKFPVSDAMIKKKLAIYSPIIHPSFFATRQLYQKLHGYDSKHEYAEDYEFLMRAKQKYTVANIPQKLIKLRFWPKRRSMAQMKKIDRADFKVKLMAFKKGYFGKYYITMVVAKFFVTFLTPYVIKKHVAKLVRLT